MTGEVRNPKDDQSCYIFLNLLSPYIEIKFMNNLKMGSCIAYGIVVNTASSHPQPNLAPIVTEKNVSPPSPPSPPLLQRRPPSFDYRYPTRVPLFIKEEPSDIDK